MNPPDITFSPCGTGRKPPKVQCSPTSALIPGRGHGRRRAHSATLGGGRPECPTLPGPKWTVRHQSTVMPTSTVPTLERSTDAGRCRQRVAP